MVYLRCSKQKKIRNQHTVGKVIKMNTTITKGSNKFEVTKSNTGVAVYIDYMNQTYTGDLEQYDEIMDVLEDQPTLSEIVTNDAENNIDGLIGVTLTADLIDRVYMLNKLMNNYTWENHNDYSTDMRVLAMEILDQYFENLVDELNLG